MSHAAPARCVLFSMIFLPFFLSLAFPALAQSPQRMEITFDVQPDMSVIQTSTFFFSSPASGDVNYTAGGSIRNVEASAGGERLEHRTEGSTIIITVRKPAAELTLKYIADSLVFTSDSVRHFFTEFSFAQPVDISAQLRLPEGFGIYQNSFRPEAEIASDGRRVILLWNVRSQSALFSAKFVPLDQGGGLLPAAVFVLVAIIIILYLYYREKSREDFMQGFREDERRTIEYLRQRRVALQSDLQKEFKFSRAKATRIVAVLEQKGLARKRRYGRTNRLEWS